jgi:hypothetical protein
MEWNELMKIHLSTIDTDSLDRLKFLVEQSVGEKLTGIDSALDDVQHQPNQYSEANKDSLIDDALCHFTVQDNFNALSIIGLYRLIEEKHNLILPNDGTHYSYWQNVKNKIPIDIKNGQDFKNVNILRLLNNAIKHGKIRKELSDLTTEYGTKGECIDFSTLEDVYTNSKLSAQRYIKELYNYFN